MEPKESFEISIPDFCVVVLVGISGSGKSTFAGRHFLRSETLSSDAFRALVSDDANDQGATRDAFDALHYLAAIRLRRRRLVVIDATNVQAEARKPLLELARAHDCLAAALVLDVPSRECIARNEQRPDRAFSKHVILNQARQLRQSVRMLKREGFRYVYTLEPERIEQARIVRQPLWTDRRRELGPFDIVGDLHGCCDELIDLLLRLGYQQETPDAAWRHPAGRRVIFLGDLVDRGPKVVETVRLASRMVAGGQALCVPGNHDMKLLRALKGNAVSVAHGLAESLAQIEALPEEERAAFKEDYARFADSLVSHYWLDEGRLCVAHAGMKESYIGRASGRVREFALYGETTGEVDEFGLPVRLPWAEEYRGSASVVYGHTPVFEAEWLNGTLNIDTGCVFGGKLTALKWPEREIVQIAARRVYAAAARPFLPSEAEASSESSESEPAASALQWQHDELLRAEDVLGKRRIETRTAGAITIPAENAAAALEVMSRFAVEPRWLIYLPPTMSPCAAAHEGEMLERPAEAFAYYRELGVETVVCQRKHMGSRAVIVVCRDAEATARRFGATGEAGLGQCYTRTGRQFFDDPSQQSAFLAETADAIGSSGLWEELETDWLCLDCEIMPWNAKAQGLLREQYAPVGAAGGIALNDAAVVLDAGVRRGLPLQEALTRIEERQEAVARYRDAYARYCWSVSGLEELRVAPFHLLATEGRTYFDRSHAWHTDLLARLAGCSPRFLATEMQTVQPADQGSCAQGEVWWRTLTEDGGEGMVVKPWQYLTQGPKGLVQPAVKVRGREYLRIIYGPEYTRPENLGRLRARGLGAKRALALREFALGVEGLERFVRKEPLRRVHECAFGVLALESEPVDPRL